MVKNIFQIGIQKHFNVLFAGAGTGVDEVLALNPGSTDNLGTSRDDLASSTGEVVVGSVEPDEVIARPQMESRLTWGETSQPPAPVRSLSKRHVNPMMLMLVESCQLLTLVSEWRPQMRCQATLVSPRKYCQKELAPEKMFEISHIF